MRTALAMHTGTELEDDAQLQHVRHQFDDHVDNVLVGHLRIPESAHDAHRVDADHGQMFAHALIDAVITCSLMCAAYPQRACQRTHTRMRIAVMIVHA